MQNYLFIEGDLKRLAQWVAGPSSIFIINVFTLEIGVLVPAVIPDTCATPTAHVEATEAQK